LSGAAAAPTAEKLMRSRYTAFTRADIAYIKKTLGSAARKDFDAAEAKKWATESEWKGLKIISTQKGTETDKKGTVEFTVTFTQKGETLDHHEVAQFTKNDKGEWEYTDGDAHTHKEGEGHHHHHSHQQTIVREGPKVGRNDPCPCGSGKKYKKCHAIEA
jgi:SEC-C motif domain protein